MAACGALAAIPFLIADDPSFVSVRQLAIGLPLPQRSGRGGGRGGGESNRHKSVEIPIPLTVGRNTSHPVDLAFVGDVMLGRWVGAEIRRHGPDYPFTKASAELRRADLAIGNLECALSRAPFAHSKQFQLRGDPAEAPALRRAGFAAMTLANNHALDCGPLGLSDSVAALASAGVRPLGVTPRATIFIRRGVRIAVLAYCDFPHDSGGAGIQYTDEATLARDLALAKKNADIAVVFWHWGVGLSPQVSARQTHLARLAMRDGADVVVGCHPHVLQPVEKTRHGVIAYSLGNFVFDARPGAQSQSEILHVFVTKHGASGFRVSRYRIRNCRPQPG